MPKEKQQDEIEEKVEHEMEEIKERELTREEKIKKAEQEKLAAWVPKTKLGRGNKIWKN